MSLSALILAMGQQEPGQREREEKLLAEITQLSSQETAGTAAERFNHKKHTYTFEGYLYQLSKLRTVLAAGVSASEAVEAVDCCMETETIIKGYKRRRYQNVQTEDCKMPLENRW